MTLTHKTDFYESKNVRAYLKTRKGVYFKELTGETKEKPKLFTARSSSSPTMKYMGSPFNASATVSKLSPVLLVQQRGIAAAKKSG